MGHKAHPVGLRLGIHRKWQSNWFFKSKNYTNFLYLNLNIEKFFKGYLYFYGRKSLLLNCQLIKLSSNQLFIFIFFYRFRKKKIKTKRLKKNFFKWRNFWEQYLIKNKQIYEKNNTFNLSKSKIFNFFNLKTNFYKINLYNSFNIIVKSFLIKTFIYLKKNINKFILIKNFLKNFKNENKILLKKIIIKINLFVLFLKILKIFFCNSIKNKIILFKLSYIKILYNKYFLTNWLSKNNKINFLKIYFIIFYKKIINKLNKKILLLKYKVKKYSILKKIKNNNFILTKTKFNNNKIKTRKLLSKSNFFASISQVKQFLSLLTNSKINLIFINTLSFTKFFYFLTDNKAKKRERFNVFQLQRFMLNKYKYNAIFIKDFIYLTFIAVLFKNTNCIVKFIAEQFKRLPKNRKQLKLLRFIQQSLKILCGQRKEITGFKLLIKGRLNRRTRTRKWNLQKGILPLQTQITRVEYGYSEGFTRSGLIGIKLWFFYKKTFSKTLKKKLLQYFYYSKYKKYLKKSNVKTKSKKISKK